MVDKNYNYNRDWVDKYKTHATEKFKDFKAMYVDGIVVDVLDWRNANDSGDYYVRAIFDKKKGRIYISGDLGDGILCNYNENLTLEKFGEYWDLGYFLEKIVASSEEPRFDAGQFAEDVKKAANYNDADDDDKEDIETLIHELLDSDEFNDGFSAHLHDECLDMELERLAGEYFEWLPSAGRQIPPRYILWYIALKMAYKQLYND